MSRTGPRTSPLGDVVVVAFDLAGRYSTDPKEVSRLATKAVLDILRCAPWTPIQEMDKRGGGRP